MVDREKNEVSINMIAINETLKLLPPEAKQEVFDFVEFLALKYLKKKVINNRSKKILSLAGSWKDMNENDFQNLRDEITQRRKQSFSRRREM